MMKFGCRSGVGRIEKLLLKHPRDAFIDQQNVRAQWKELNYLGCPGYDRVLEEYDGFLALLRETVPGIHFLPRDPDTGLDSIYVHDPVVMTAGGAVLGNMGKAQREGEPRAASEFLEELGVPILGAVTGAGTVEAGDVVVFDEFTLAVGHGYRTNGEGIRQLRELTGGFIRELVVVPLPHWDGPADILHLMSFISPIDRHLAVVYPRLMPVPFLEWLKNRGMKLLEVPDSEYPTMACNILAVAPGRCIMLAGNPRTREMLEAEGVEVLEFSGEDLCHKGGGGPTCLTRPLLRRD